MRPKHVFIFIVLAINLLVITPLSALAENAERGLTIEMGFSLNRFPEPESEGGIRKRTPHIISPVFIPRIGYRFNPQWSMGLMYVNNTINTNRFYSERYNGFGAYIQHSFFSFAGERLSFFTDLHYLYNHTLNGNNFTECGLVPGLVFHIPGAPVDIKLRYLFLGFNDNLRFIKADSGGCLGRGNFILDAGLHRFQIGASVTF